MVGQAGKGERPEGEPQLVKGEPAPQEMAGRRLVRGREERPGVERRLVMEEIDVQDTGSSQYSLMQGE